MLMPISQIGHQAFSNIDHPEKKSKHSPQNETSKLLDMRPPSSNVAPVNTTIAISIVATYDYD